MLYGVAETVAAASEWLFMYAMLAKGGLVMYGRGKRQVSVQLQRARQRAS